MLNTPAQSIGSIVPVFGAGDDGGGSGGQTQDHQSPAIIVGCEPQGDTIFVCDILDPGDGSGIQLALNQSMFESFGDVFVRRGFYSLAERLDATPGIGGGSILLRGEGSGSTILYCAGTDRCAIEQTNTTSDELLDLRDLGILLVSAQTGASGTAVLDLTHSVQSNVIVEFLGTVDMAEETLLAGFRLVTGTTLSDEFPYTTRNCHVIGGPSYLRGERSMDGLFASFQTEFSGEITYSRRLFDGCLSLNGSDIGFYGDGSHTFTSCNVFGAAYAGFSLSSHDYSMVTGCMVHLGYFGQTDANMPAFAFGAYGDSGVVQFVNCIATTSVPTESEVEYPAYSLDHTDGDSSAIVCCYSVDFQIGVFIGSGETDARVVACANYAGFIQIDDNGTSSEIGLNV